jgi:hypothetical protein
MHMLFSLIQALRMYKPELPFSIGVTPLTFLPSKQIYFSITLSRKRLPSDSNTFDKASGSSFCKTRLKVSCEGIPLGRSKIVVNQS